ncbi:MAG TPA: hypothetical protein VE988_20600 [Gemmataceae bacterium]|nr:hypothetical protein [Gemmataceae bacterium]
MFQTFRELVRSIFRNLVIAAGSEGIQEALALLSRDLANAGADDASKAAPTLIRLGVQPATLTATAPSAPAAIATTPPTVEPAPPIQLASPPTNNLNRPEARIGPGRPRKHQQGGQS